MQKIRQLMMCALIFSASATCVVAQTQPLRVLSWEGYVTKQDLQAVNQQLKQQGYDYRVELVTPYAEGAKQMFDMIRSNHCDIAFLTLFFIKMENQQTAKLLQAINVKSPRLSNYKNLLSGLTHLKMGLNDQGQPLYIPWGGGAYGFYINRNLVAKEDVPVSVKELWLDKWKGRFSLNQSQQWYNIGLTLMSMGKSPFYFYELAQQEKFTQLESLEKENNQILRTLSSLYDNAGNFWTGSTVFDDKLLIVSSWGPEIVRENNKGENWQMIPFMEGHMVWLDTINFVKDLAGTKLEAAEIFANYFIGKKVQSRISEELSMVAASKLAPANKLLGDPEQVFKQHMFVPPYDKRSYNIMGRMAGKALYNAKNK